MRRLWARHRLARQDEADDRSADAGFTLIELMITLLVMAILLAIAVPVFLGVRAGAQDKSAQSDLVNAAIDAKTYYAQNGSFGQVASQVSVLQDNEPELHFSLFPITASPPHQIEAVVFPTDNNIMILVGESLTQRCWYVEINEETQMSAFTITALQIAGWSTAEGVSYGGTSTEAGPQSSCWPILFPVPTTFTGWSQKFPA